MREIEEIVSALLATHEPAALATLVSVEGSSYRRPGARLLSLGATRIGSISGGCLEEDIILRAERVLSSGVAELAVYDTTDENDLVWGVGMGCQGVVRVLIERIPAERPAWIAVVSENLAQRRATELLVHYGAGALSGGTTLREYSASAAQANLAFAETIEPSVPLFIFGAGDDAQPLVLLAKSIGWRVTVFDSRPAYATAKRFPTADQVTVIEERVGMKAKSLPAEAMVVVMSHRYEADFAALRALWPQPLHYLGILGPRKRTARMLQELEREGIAPAEELRTHLHAPVGLDLGAGTAAEIAVAIVAEMMAVLAERTPVHLRERRTSIHGNESSRTMLPA